MIQTGAKTEDLMTKKIRIGNVFIGGGEPIAIQSMTNTDTMDTESTVKQIIELEDAGCEIIRVAAYDLESAANIRNIKDRTSIPIVADVHFDFRIAIKAIECGADKVRINPGNIGSEDNIRKVADCAKMHKVPIRVGANTGSLSKRHIETEKSEALVTSALDNIRVLEKYGFNDIVVALKASDAVNTVKAYEIISKIVDYPLHIGVTEAGTERNSLIKSAIGIGSLLLNNIGDTIRVSMSDNPVKEIYAAKDILQFSGKRRFRPEIISCPTCGRTRIDLIGLVKEVEEKLKDIKKPIKVAVMGCVVNGPGEAGDADMGVAGGTDEGLIFLRGKVIKKVEYSQIADELKTLAEEY